MPLDSAIRELGEIRREDERARIQEEIEETEKEIEAILSLLSYEARTILKAFQDHLKELKKELK